MLATWPIMLTLGLGLFAIGTVVGSFLNVCIHRFPWQKSVIWTWSHCPHCYHRIAPRDNVPIVGWLALRGACRDCHAPIALRYPMVEALVGLLGKPIADCSALIIPTALYGHPRGTPAGAWRFITGQSGCPMAELGWKSLGVLELTALPSIGQARWEPS